VPYARRGPLCFAMVSFFLYFKYFIFHPNISKTAGDCFSKLSGMVVWWAGIENNVFRFSKFCRGAARVKK